MFAFLLQPQKCSCSIKNKQRLPWPQPDARNMGIQKNTHLGQFWTWRNPTCTLGPVTKILDLCRDSGFTSPFQLRLAPWPGWFRLGTWPATRWRWLCSVWLVGKPWLASAGLELASPWLKLPPGSVCLIRSLLETSSTVLSISSTFLQCLRVFSRLFSSQTCFGADSSIENPWCSWVKENKNTCRNRSKDINKALVNKSQKERIQDILPRSQAPSSSPKVFSILAGVLQNLWLKGRNWRPCSSLTENLCGMCFPQFVVLCQKF